MTVVDDNLPIVDYAQQLLQDFGLSNSRVVLRTETYAGGATGKGVKSIVDVEFLPRPDVEDMGDGGYKIGGITPAFPGGGFTVAQLLPPQTPGVDTFLILTGPNGLAYNLRIVDVVVQDPFEYVLMARDRR